MQARPHGRRRWHRALRFFFLGVISTFSLQLAFVGVTLLIDRSERPIFPRWLGYVNFWLAIMFTPESFLVFFKTGPLAWNGLLVWWFPLLAFLIWFVPNFICLVRAVATDDREPTAPNARLERDVAEPRGIVVLQHLVLQHPVVLHQRRGRKGIRRTIRSWSRTSPPNRHSSTSARPFGEGVNRLAHTRTLMDPLQALEAIMTRAKHDQRVNL